MKHSKAEYIIILVLSMLTLFLAGCSKKEETEQVIQNIPVRTSLLKQKEMERIIAFTGTIKAHNTTELRARFSGKVQEVFVEEGDYVKQGQTLIQLDNADLLAQLDQSKAALATAEARARQAVSSYEMTTATTNTQVDVAGAGIRQMEEMVNQSISSLNNTKIEYERTKNLYEKGAVSKQALDQMTTKFEIEKSRVDAAKSQLEQAKQNLNLAKAGTTQQLVSRDEISSAAASVEQARANVNYIEVMLSYTTITASMDGYITKRNVEPGEIIAPGDKEPAIIITDNSVVYIEGEVSESDVFGIAMGDEVTVILKALGNEEFQGRIQAIIPSADPMSRSFRVKAAVQNPQNRLKNGMSALVKASVETLTGIVVPRHWLRQIEGEYYVTTITDKNQASHQKVILSYLDENFALISEGINIGDEVISTGQEELKEGDPVEVKGSDDINNKTNDSSDKKRSGEITEIHNPDQMDPDNESPDESFSDTPLQNNAAPLINDDQIDLESAEKGEDDSQ